ncbi:regulatory protein RecX [Porphyromonas sp. oral taxon 275]|uniref:regulatory protein RecX n=1 Tax=Porphyromonas sp. oral taxon 275 TaxID=712435 RepID=UPI001BADA7EF|nr:regulatory protein RecX [Porphyromonas sp. oral taxon 275]QUB42636.1 regulatory protein RecX [Porphyromonas sp. oral taxon 275]
MKQTELTPQEAYARLANYCAQAERSPSDLRRRMQRLELAEELQAELLTRLEAEGFVSGERFARAFVHDKHRFNGWGPRRLEHELRRHGIASSVIAAALEELEEETSAEDEEPRVLELLRTKQRSLPAGLERRKAFDRLMRFGLYRGYDYDEVREAITQLLDTDEPDWEED